MQINNASTSLHVVDVSFLTIITASIYQKFRLLLSRPNEGNDVSIVRIEIELNLTLHGPVWPVASSNQY